MAQQSKVGAVLGVDPDIDWQQLCTPNEHIAWFLVQQPAPSVACPVQAMQWAKEHAEAVAQAAATQVALQQQQQAAAATAAAAAASKAAAAAKRIKQLGDQAGSGFAAVVQQARRQATAGGGGAARQGAGGALHFPRCN